MKKKIIMQSLIENSLKSYLDTWRDANYLSKIYEYIGFYLLSLLLPAYHTIHQRRSLRRNKSFKHVF